MDEKELFEQFMHHNMPQEAFDPDQVLAAARKAVPDDYQPSEHFKKDMDNINRGRSKIEFCFVPYFKNYRLFFKNTTIANAANITAPVPATGTESPVFGWFLSALFADVTPLLLP